jgi:hypothetical protein
VSALRRTLAVVEVVALTAVAALGGFVVGERSVDDVAPSSAAPPLPPPVDTAVALASDVAELALPRADLEGFLPWRVVVTEIQVTFTRHGLDLELDQEAATLARLQAAGRPDELAALLDGLAEAARHAELEPVRSFASRLAQALDPDPTRSRLREAIAAGDASTIRAIAGDVDAEQLDARTATLLGAALLRCGETNDALETWRTAALEHPREVALHRLIAWRLYAGETTADVDEARRHLEVVRALLPGNERVKRELERLDQ